MTRVWALAFLFAGCGAGATSPAQQAPPPSAPTPESVTREEPGGDAEDPHAAALTRLIESPWGHRSDKDGQLEVPLPDAEHWKRVRYFGVEHFVGFRYGADHHGIVIAFVQDSEEPEPSSQTCLRRFEAWGRPQIEAFDVMFDPFQPHYMSFREHPVIALSVDGRVSLGFSRPEFSAAWAAFTVYPNACLILAVAVPHRERPDLARQVRDRFVEEGFLQLVPDTETRPHRK